MKKNSLDMVEDMLKEEKEIRDSINLLVWEMCSNVYSFLESMESNREVFCDCDGLANEGTCHQDDCQCILLSKDIENLENKISEKKDKNTKKN